MGKSRASKVRASRGLEKVERLRGKAKRAIAPGAGLLQQAVSERARFRYDQGIQAFCEFFRANLLINFGVSCSVILSLMLNLELGRYLRPDDVQYLDILLGMYFELAFSEDPVSLLSGVDPGGLFFPLRARWECSQLLCGLGDVFPEASGRLRRATRCLVAWGRLSTVKRAPPMPERLIRAVLAWAVRANLLSFAVIIALQFYALLRPGECWGLARRCVNLVNGTVVVSIEGSKSARNKGNVLEHATVRDPHIAFLIMQWLGCIKDSNSCICPNASDVRRCFDMSLRDLNCGELGFRLYSLRRGGATLLFQEQLGQEQLLIRGRWQSFKTARVYLEDGAARLALLHLPAVLPSL
jgi:hypothetical protein